MTVIFGTGYVVIALMVLFPPAYLAASGSQPLVFGMPLSIFYMFLNAVLLILLVTGLWLIEGVRDEREIHMTEDADLHPSGE
jgi:hypothetical protein